MREPAVRSCAYSLYRAAYVVVLIIGLASFAVPGTAVSAVFSPAGAWLIGGTGAAVQIFDCNGRLCGQIAWLRVARDNLGRLSRDGNNPNPAFRQRPLCGLTVLQGLKPAGPDRWNGGSLYNPDDGKTYSVSAELRSADVFVARIYLGVPLFGETKTLLRIPRLNSEGWC